jgi:hypothetical protein
MAEFMILIHGDPPQREAMSAERQHADGGGHTAFRAAADQVVTLASQLPEVHAGHSGIEIRPVADHG